MHRNHVICLICNLFISHFGFEGKILVSDHCLFFYLWHLYENMSVQYTAIFHGCKNDNFQMIFFYIFLIFAQNIDCGYTLEPPQRGGSNEYPQSMFWSKNKKNMYTRVNPTFYIKVGCKGVFITRTCYPDVLLIRNVIVSRWTAKAH